MLGGAIGDAWGSSYENESVSNTATTYYLGGQPKPVRQWGFTDDTQLNMATCEALCKPGLFDPAYLTASIVQYYRERRLTGLGASTLKAITELQEGGHWSQVGRSGEFAAGNGAAMRIAPFAFFPDITREHIRDACRITHRNEEAYVGALAIYLSIKTILSGAWNGDINLLDLIIPELPDTRVRDRLIEINELPHADIKGVGLLGSNGYVVNSVPLAIFAATQIRKVGMSNMYQSIIEAGGDTDTNASLAGQIGGCLIGIDNFPSQLTQKLSAVDGYDWVCQVVQQAKAHFGALQ